MPKSLLRINKSNVTAQHRNRTLGMRELLLSLVESNLFDISYHNDTLSTLRGERASIIYYNDKKIYLDLWEYCSPTYTTNAYDANFDLIIKLQDKPLTRDIVEKWSKRKGLLNQISAEERWEYTQKIIPWTFFPSRLMLKFVGQEESLQQSPVDKLGFFCGKAWRYRKNMMQKIKDAGMEVTKSKQEHRFTRPLNDKDYLKRMQTSKYGIILKGKASYYTEGKNRREIDYMMLKKPLLMNYKPYYYNPLVEGEHYIYIDEKTDYNNLENLYNIKEIANNGYEWYKNNASKYGAAKVFLQIMNDKFGL